MSQQTSETLRKFSPLKKGGWGGSTRCEPTTCETSPTVLNAVLTALLNAVSKYGINHRTTEELQP
jgi:hypothetical protein